MIFFGIFIGLETFYMVSNLLSICWIFLTKNTTISIEVNWTILRIWDCDV